jgi:SET domain-containing protein
MALSEKHLVIKRSTLPKAGKGLFSKKFIPKGTRIAEYKGKIRTWKEIKGEPEFNGYVYYINRNYVIDAKKTTRVKARFANDARGLHNKTGLRNNSKYEEDGLKVYITAIKDIPPGTEILVGYGKEYWDSIRENNQ